MKPPRASFREPAAGPRGTSPSYPRGRPRASACCIFARTARGWRPVGRIVDGDGLRVFMKRVDPGRHRLLSPPAYALEETTLNELVRARVAMVEIHEVGGRVLRAPLRAFFERGIPVHRGGFARQLALPLSAWAAERPGQPRLLEVAS